MLFPPSRPHGSGHINQHCPINLLNVDTAKTRTYSHLTTTQGVTSSTSLINATSAGLEARYLAMHASALPKPVSLSTTTSTSAASHLYPSSLAPATQVTSPFILPQIGDAVHTAATNETLPETYLEKYRKLNDLMDQLAAFKSRSKELAAAEHCGDSQSQGDLESEAASSSTGGRIYFPILENSTKTDHFATKGTN